jgi:hypothetical protein
MLTLIDIEDETVESSVLGSRNLARNAEETLSCLRINPLTQVEVETKGYDISNKAVCLL